MGQRRLVVTGDLVVEASKQHGGVSRSFTVENGLPDDVEIVRYMQQPSRYGASSSSVLWVVLQSAAWEGDELGAGQELDPPRFTVNYEDETAAAAGIEELEVKEPEQTTAGGAELEEIASTNGTQVSEEPVAAPAPATKPGAARSRLVNRKAS